MPLLAFFGRAESVSAITTRRVAEYRVSRLATKSRRGTLLAPATVNRECALLRSILRMALAWDELTKLPVFKMTKEEGKQRYRRPEEITRLLAACGDSRNKLLLRLVTVDLHTGLRKGELLGLTWEQVDFGRGVIVLGRRTKSGKGRDVPINQAVYTALAPLRSDAGGLEATGRAWRTIRKIDTAYNGGAPAREDPRHRRELPHPAPHVRQPLRDARRLAGEAAGHPRPRVDPHHAGVRAPGAGSLQRGDSHPRGARNG